MRVLRIAGLRWPIRFKGGSGHALYSSIRFIVPTCGWISQASWRNRILERELCHLPKEREREIGRKCKKNAHLADSLRHIKIIITELIPDNIESRRKNILKYTRQRTGIMQNSSMDEECVKWKYNFPTAGDDKIPTGKSFAPWLFNVCQNTSHIYQQEISLCCI